MTFTNSFTPANQIAGATISKSNYRYTPAASGTDSYGTVNGLNQYPTVTPAASSAQTVSYDARGNLICAGTSCPTGTPGANAWVYAYDPENRMLTAGNGTIAAAYAYDPLGRRITKSGTGVTTTNFVHDGDSEIAEYDSSGALVRRYVPGPVVDQPVAMVACTGSGCTGSNATKTFFHVDKLGSVIAMSSTTGSRTEGPYLYDSYGNCYNPNGTACSNGVPYRYTGQRLDPETGLHYYRARYYSSSLGRFMQTDPVGYKDGLNWYAYVGNDPTDLTDPTGKTLAGGFVGAGIGADVGGGVGAIVGLACGPGAPLCEAVTISGGTFLGTLGGALLGDLLTGADHAVGPTEEEKGKLIGAGGAADRNGLTRAGRSFQKHTAGSGKRQGGGRTPPTNKTSKDYNTAGAKEIARIVNDEKTTWTQTSKGGWQAQAPNGQGAAWNADGSFQGFREPPSATAKP